MNAGPICAAASVLLWACFALPGRAPADTLVGAYVEPWIGGVGVDYKSLEIKKSFVTSTEPPDPAGADGDTDDVGLRSRYEGGSASFGVSAGLRLKALKLGVHAAWSSPRFDGYWKSYRYSPELKRATGQKVYAGGEVKLNRVMFEVAYGFPFWRFEFGFITRIGGVAFRPKELEVGPSVDERGLCAEMGARLDFAVVRYVSIGFAATVGGFVFDGSFDGAFGVYRTYSGVISLHL